MSKKKIAIFAVITAIALVISLMLELTLFSVDKKAVIDKSAINVYSNKYSYEIIGYSVNGNEFTPLTNDPQIIFKDINKKFSKVYIEFSSPTSNITTDIQVFYDNYGEEFTEINSVIKKNILFGTKFCIIDIPQDLYQNLRIDINGSFEISRIILSNSPIKIVKSHTGFSFARWISLSILLILVSIIFANYLLSPDSELKLSKTELVFCFGCLVFYALWILKPFNYAPDETMRYDVTQFFFNNNRLPRDKETIAGAWGFSYAHLPTMLCNVIDYVFMKFTSLFIDSQRAYLLSARMVSVFGGVGTVYFTIKSSKLLFKSPVRWIMILLVATLPQFVFITSYVNNDILAMLGISIILYAWLLAIKFNWNYKNATYLCVGMAIAALSYYNSYAWILCSIFLFFIIYIEKNKSDYKGLIKLTSYIVILTAILASYLFIRHLVLYGDLLGFKTTREYGRLYGVEELQSYNRSTPKNMGVSLKGMLFEWNWLKISYKSFIGCFGYMVYWLPEEIYNIYSVFFIVCIIGLIWKLADIIIKKKKYKFSNIALYVCFALCIVITISLSVYNSYTTDFQPQGRYCLPILPAIAIFFTKGAEKLISKFKENIAYGIVGFTSACMIGVSVGMYYLVYLPSV